MVVLPKTGELGVSYGGPHCCFLIGLKITHVNLRLHFLEGLKVTVPGSGVLFVLLWCRLLCFLNIVGSQAPISSPWAHSSRFTAMGFASTVEALNCVSGLWRSQGERTKCCTVLTRPTQTGSGWNSAWDKCEFEMKRCCPELRAPELPSGCHWGREPLGKWEMEGNFSSPDPFLSCSHPTST